MGFARRGSGNCRIQNLLSNPTRVRGPERLRRLGHPADLLRADSVQFAGNFSDQVRAHHDVPQPTLRLLLLEPARRNQCVEWKLVRQPELVLRLADAAMLRNDVLRIRG